MEDSSKDSEKIYDPQEILLVNSMASEMWHLLSNVVTYLPRDVHDSLLTCDYTQRMCIDDLFMDVIVVSEYVLNYSIPINFEEDFCKPFILLYFKFVEFYNEDLQRQGWQENKWIKYYNCFLHLLSSWLAYYPKCISLIINSDSGILEELLKTCDVFSPRIPFDACEYTDTILECGTIPTSEARPLKRDASLDVFNFLSGGIIERVVLEKLLLPLFYYSPVPEISQNKAIPIQPRIDWPNSELILGEYSAGNVKYQANFQPHKMLDENHLIVTPSDNYWDPKRLSKNLTSILQHGGCKVVSEIQLGQLYGYLLFNENEVIGLRVLPVAMSQDTYVLYEVDFGKFIECKALQLFFLPNALKHIPYCCNFVVVSGFSPLPNLELVTNILLLIHNLVYKKIITPTALKESRIFFILYALFLTESEELVLQSGKILQTLLEMGTFVKMFPYPVHSSFIRQFSDVSVNPLVLETRLSILNNVMFHSQVSRKELVKKGIIFMLLRLLHPYPMLEELVWRCMRGATVFKIGKVDRISPQKVDNELFKLLGYGTETVSYVAHTSVPKFEKGGIVTLPEKHDVEIIRDLEDLMKPKWLSMVICGLVNGLREGEILIGAQRENGTAMVMGVTLDRKKRDSIIYYITCAVDEIRPSIPHDKVNVELVPVLDSSTSRLLTLIRIFITPSLDRVHYVNLGYDEPKVYGRYEHQTVALSAQEVRALVISKYRPSDVGANNLNPASLPS